MDIEKEQLKLRLIEAQMQVLQYQHREVLANIEAITKAKNEQLPTTGTCVPDQSDRLQQPC